MVLCGFSLAEGLLLQGSVEITTQGCCLDMEMLSQHG